MTELSIHAAGPPPERHADRVVANMLRELAERRAKIIGTITEAFKASKDGGPRAQARMAKRVERAGATHVHLRETGKKGRYKLDFYETTGWDPTRDTEIKPGDPIPEKPWIACYITKIENEGRGRVNVKSAPLLLITHHALSRTAQRLGLRTGEHIVETARLIWNGAADLLNKKGWDETMGKLPPNGHRAAFAEEKATVVLKKHETRNVLIATTVF